MHDRGAADLTARIVGWLGDEGIDPSYVHFVVRHAIEPDATWRWCCGSHCDPCVTRLGRVVDRTRLASPARPVPGEARILRDLPPGLPGDRAE
ncbi:MAG: hypothetical protein WAT39_10795 [Planctomycetota bacterium]